MITGESEICLAGGVDLLLDETPYLILSEAQALSPDGLCHTFDEKANGFVPGEGCGMVLLKPLIKALQEGDRIYAVIEASGMNNDGRTMGITTPNPQAQQALIEATLQKGKISSDTISYVETHGTGTAIGDPIELKALSTVFSRSIAEAPWCAVGSVKTNIGHLLSAAGIASFIKVALSLYYKQIPPTLHCEIPNPRFDFAHSPFCPNQDSPGLAASAGNKTSKHQFLWLWRDQCSSYPARSRKQRNQSGSPLLFASYFFSASVLLEGKEKLSGRKKRAGMNNSCSQRLSS